MLPIVCPPVLPESEAVNEQEVQGEGFSDADAQRPAQSSAPSASGTSKSGRVLTDAVLEFCLSLQTPHDILTDSCTSLISLLSARGLWLGVVMLDTNRN